MCIRDRLYVLESLCVVIVVVKPKSSSASAVVGLGTTTILSSLVEPVAVSVNISAVASLITLAYIQDHTSKF